MRSRKADVVAYGDFIGSLPYDYSHWVALTFRRAASENVARQCIARWLRWLDIVAKGPVYYAWVLEQGPLNGRLHFHVLLAFPKSKPLSIGTIKKGWQEGYAYVRSFDYSRSAIYYFSKEFSKNLIDWDIRGRPKTRSGATRSNKDDQLSLPLKLRRNRASTRNRKYA
jgi:hypothetical protein